MLSRGSVATALRELSRQISLGRVVFVVDVESKTLHFVGTRRRRACAAAAAAAARAGGWERRPARQRDERRRRRRRRR